MTGSNNAGPGRAGGNEPEVPELLTVQGVADILSVSTATVRRMTDSGRMPGVIRMGSALTRWRRSVITEWINDNCPKVRVARGAR